MYHRQHPKLITTTFGWTSEGPQTADNAIKEVNVMHYCMLKYDNS